MGAACLIAAAGATHAGSPERRLFAEGRHIVVLGSSTAAGWGPTEPESAWVNRFLAAAQEVDPERTVTNLAVPGYTTYHLLPSDFVAPKDRPEPDPEHNITAALADGPDAIIINLPSNDVVNGYSIEEQLANYDTILAVAASLEVPVWITTTQPRNISSPGRQLLMVMRDSTFAHFGDYAIDFWSEIANPNGTINDLYDSGDGIHLNDRAHGILFERVADKHIWEAIAPVVTGTAATLPTARLFSPSPNPFRRATTLSYSLATETRVELDLFDVRGRKIQTLEDRVSAPGFHSVPLEGRDLPSGIYFYRLHTNAGTAVGKVVRLE